MKKDKSSVKKHKVIITLVETIGRDIPVKWYDQGYVLEIMCRNIPKALGPYLKLDSVTIE